ncbi:ribosomal biogenesis factor [Dromaius novaehollandiae]|uniref:ribosomal biogenesis factor n=1 Tax=Dromaius novaehollandiae TaxID=8790 RepID=UPI00311F8317
MGKSRARGSGSGSVFGAAGARAARARAKAKGRARPVRTALRKINIVNDEKVRALNKAFTEVQKEVKQLSKGTAAEPQKEHQVSEHLEHEPANVDAATSLLSQL